MGETNLPNDTHTTRASRAHLHSDVKQRMKTFCNEICPRNETGVMLGHKAYASSKRPAWCIERIIKSLHNEFDSEQLTHAREKALSYMARTSCTFKRLQNLTDASCEKMTEPARPKQRELLKEFEVAAESWRQGPMV